MKDLVLKIHDSGHQVVLAITGGGAEAVGELLRHGRGSNTLLEAVIPYNQKAFDDFVRGKPDKYCSEGAARDLAMAAYQRALDLTGDINFAKYIGIGVSCSLVKEGGEREGRVHHAFIAVQEFNRTSTYMLSLHGHGYTREQEESLVAEAVINALAFAAGVMDGPPVGEHVGEYLYTTADENTKNVVLGVQKLHTIGNKKSDGIIFPGAFNPFHEQHARMAEAVYKLTGKMVDLELCVRNVDKPALNYQEIEARVQSLSTFADEAAWLKNIHLTGTPTFAEKAKLFPGATFLVGYDTFARISNPKYGDLDTVVKTFKELGTKFLVFHRIIDGKSTADSDLNLIYPPLLEISKIFDRDTLPPVEISSTAIRKRHSA